MQVDQPCKRASQRHSESQSHTPNTERQTSVTTELQVPVPEVKTEIVNVVQVHHTALAELRHVFAGGMSLCEGDRGRAQR